MIPAIFQILQSSHTTSSKRLSMSSSDSSSYSSSNSASSSSFTPQNTPSYLPPSPKNSTSSLKNTKNEQENDKNNYNQEPLSPELCKYKLLLRFEDLVNKLAAGWKYHVANTEGVKESWSRFEHFYLDLCSYTEG
uniref:Uncharacterized protein n=1 Tax=Meloidogyne incognita TaxID=6306 RepID=A0A914L4N7_MELIC